MLYLSRIYLTDGIQYSAIRKFGASRRLYETNVSFNRNRFEQNITVDSHITNPNESTVGLLILRASQHQAPVYRDFVRRHFQGEGAIRVAFTVRLTLQNL